MLEIWVSWSRFWQILSSALFVPVFQGASRSQSEVPSRIQTGSTVTYRGSCAVAWAAKDPTLDLASRRCCLTASKANNKNHNRNEYSK